MYVCICNAVTERQVRECLRSGARSLEDLAFKLGLGAGCGRCRECAAGLLEERQRRDSDAATETALIQCPRAVGA